MPKYILALDQGTTSSRAILFTKNAQVKDIEQEEFRQFFPQSAWVEHDPMEILKTQLGVITKLMVKNKLSAKHIEAIGITNQRETTVVWEKKTGKPVYNAIVWQDRRTASTCEKMQKEGLKSYVQANTGLVLDAYFSATKIKWILDNVKGARAKAKNGELLFGTIDTWLLWNLTKGKVHATDYSNASRTMIYNIKKLAWDESLLKYLKIPKQMLPEVRDSSGSFGETAQEIFSKPIPISGIAGDQQAALFGQACTKAGMAKNTYGTGCFLLMNTGSKFVKSKNGLITTLAWGLNGKVTYALEGSVFIAGAAIQWLRDGLKILDQSKDSEYYATKINDTDGVYVVPAFAGLGAPYWDMSARGAILGLTRATNKAHVIRACLESLAYQTKDVLDAMQKDSKVTLQKLRVDGGASANDFLMQFQSDMLQVPVERPKIIETTALGAAFLAGLHTGFYNKSELDKTWKKDKAFKPKMDKQLSKEKYKGWAKAVNMISTK